MGYQDIRNRGGNEEGKGKKKGMVERRVKGKKSKERIKKFQKKQKKDKKDEIQRGKKRV